MNDDEQTRFYETKPKKEEKKWKININKQKIHHSKCINADDDDEI